MIDIQNIIHKLVLKHNTNDPFALCDNMGILVLFKNLKTIKGIYQNNYKKKIIHINENLDYYLKKQVCAHELGHAVLHKNINSFFLDECTFLLTNKIEIEANLFAAELLIKDEDILSNW